MINFDPPVLKNEALGIPVRADLVFFDKTVKILKNHANLNVCIESTLADFREKALN